MENPKKLWKGTRWGAVIGLIIGLGILAFFMSWYCPLYELYSPHSPPCAMSIYYFIENARSLARNFLSIDPEALYVFSMMLGLPIVAGALLGSAIQFWRHRRKS